MAEFQANSDVGAAVTIEIPNNNSPDQLASIKKDCRIECSISVTVVNDDSSITRADESDIVVAVAIEIGNNRDKSVPDGKQSVFNAYRRNYPIRGGKKCKRAGPDVQRTVSIEIANGIGRRKCGVCRHLGELIIAITVQNAANINNVGMAVVIYIKIG